VTLDKKVRTATVGVSGSMHSTRNQNMAGQHFVAARFFADQAAAAENALLAADPKTRPGGDEHRAFVVGAIALAVMGLDAAINEIYLDAVDGSTNKLAGISDQAMALLSAWWPDLERRPTLLKYQHALLLAGKPVLPRGENPCQDADNLIHLRNALTHYRPEWEDHLAEHAELRSRLHLKFTPSPLAMGNYLWFPDQCLGSDCARWAADTAEAFVRAFCARLGISERI
jgi:hypothetical protein